MLYCCKKYGGLLGLFVVLLAGCQAEEPADLGPPPGWVGTDTRWWQEGLDTTGVFRNLETLTDMGIEEVPLTYAANLSLAERSGVGHQQVERAVKQSLIRLYRNEPAVVDSLFARFVAPKIAEAPLSGDLREQVEAFKRQGYKLILNHYREPRTKLQLGQDITVVYPDSLRAQGVGGSVLTQVYLNEQGEPLAVELVEPVHPVLDALAMQATTQMRWREAYLIRRGKWRPIPSWARFKVTFRLPPEG